MIKNFFSGLACAAALCLGAGAQAALITFDPPSIIDINSPLATYDEAGFRLSGIEATFLPLDGIGTGGSEGLLVLANNKLKLTSVGGGPFSLLGFDYGPIDLFGNGLDPNAQLLVSGAVSGGGQLAQALALDSFTSFSFQGWTNLTEVNFMSRADLVLDNIALQSVPEPASLALVALALGGLVFTRRRSSAAK